MCAAIAARKKKMNKPNNPPAFPNGAIYESGMTLRDYFAAKAMMAFVSSDLHSGALSKLGAIGIRGGRSRR